MGEREAKCEEIIDIKEIFFGSSDGKNEAKNELFLSTFFDYKDMYKRLDEGKLLVLGVKGSGKTLLIEYFRKKKTQTEGSIFINTDLKEFLLKEKQIKKDNIIYDENSLLKWIIYIELSRNILNLWNENKIKTIKEVKEINNFMCKNKFDLKLDTNIIIEKIQTNKFEIGFEHSCVSWIKQKLGLEKTRIGEYHNYIYELEKKINIILSSLDKLPSIYIVFDELDYIAKESFKLLSNLIDLFHECNTEWENKGIKSRIIIGMREDVYKKLDNLNSGKIREDYGLILDWRHKEDKYSPLIQMVCHKIKKSNIKYADWSDSKIIKSIFLYQAKKSNGSYIKIQEYILGKTFLKPRDIITFFKKLQNKAEKGRKITDYQIESILRDYSATICLELRNEATTFDLTSETFDSLMNAFRMMRKTNFLYEEVRYFIKLNKKLFPVINLKKLRLIFGIFFEIGIIGNVKKINNSGTYVSYKYKDNCEINFDEIFVLHYAVREELGISTENIVKK